MQTLHVAVWSLLPLHSVSIVSSSSLIQLCLSDPAEHEACDSVWAESEVLTLLSYPLPPAGAEHRFHPSLGYLLQQTPSDIWSVCGQLEERLINPHISRHICDSHYDNATERNLFCISLMKALTLTNLKTQTQDLLRTDPIMYMKQMNGWKKSFQDGKRAGQYVFLLCLLNVLWKPGYVTFSQQWGKSPMLKESATVKRVERTVDVSTVRQH